MAWEIYKTICAVFVTGIMGIGSVIGLLISVICLIDTVNEYVVAKKEKEKRNEQ